MIHEAVSMWRAAFEDWLRHQTDEAAAEELAARHFCLLLTT